jgi:hypothetical protein
MQNVIKSFRLGLKAAAELVRSKKECEEVFSEFSNAIYRETNKKIFLYLSDDFGDKTKQYKVHYGDGYHYLLADNPEDPSTEPHFIASVTLDMVSGFPCVVQYNKDKWHCSNRVELELALSEVVSIPDISLVFFDMIK